MFAAFVPSPPLLVPALTGGASGDLADLIGPLLTACDRAVSDLIATAPATLVVVGPGDSTRQHAPEAWGTLAGYGVAVEAPQRHPDVAPELPLSLTIASWLLDRAGWSGQPVLQEVAESTSVSDCLELGRQLDQEGGPDAAWLVVGGGSNRRGARSPGFDDPRASAFDAEVSAALIAADSTALMGLDPALASDLGCVGRASWQLAAAALDGPGKADTVTHYEGAPFGVAYLVTSWRPALA